MVGKLIVFEGVDYSGKSTCIENLKPLLSELYGDKFIYTREPGNLINPEKDAKIRKILLEERLSPEQQTYLFASNRYEHTEDIIAELYKGKNVIVDRYFLSSIIYQGTIVGDNLVLHLNKNILKMLRKYNIVTHNIIFKISRKTYKDRKALRDTNDIFELDDIRIINQRIDKVLNLNENTKILGFDAKYHIVNAKDKKENITKNVLNIIQKIIEGNV